MIERGEKQKHYCTDKHERTAWGWLFRTHYFNHCNWIFKKNNFIKSIYLYILYDKHTSFWLCIFLQWRWLIYLIDTCLCIVMEYSVIFWHKCVMGNNQIRAISISVISDINYFFVLEAFRVLSSTYFEVHIKVFAWFDSKKKLLRLCAVNCFMSN